MGKMPYEMVRDLAIEYEKLNDDCVLAKLRDIPPLPDENDPAWKEVIWNEIAYPFLALWDVVAARRLREAIPLILERACFGDPGETMRGMCHTLEAIVQPNWSELTSYYVVALRSNRAGTRLWAADQLLRLRDQTALAALGAAASDPVQQVRERVQMALDVTREVDRKKENWEGRT